MIQDVKKLRDITDHPKDFFAKEKEDQIVIGVPPLPQRVKVSSCE